MPFIEVTSRTFRAYANLHNVNYDCYIGIKRGVKPWRAALNRIIILADMVKSGCGGWVFYSDADSYISDLSFDVRDYLQTKQEFAFIVSPSGIQPPCWWEINNGVFAVNLGHWAGKKVILRWEEIFLLTPEKELNNEKKWGDCVDDRALLHAAFRDCEDVEPYVYVDDVEPKIINWDALFIKQIIRECGNHAVRINKLSRAVDAVFKSNFERDVFNKEQFYEELSVALYEVLLCRRPDDGGLKYTMESLLSGSHTIKDQISLIINSDEFRTRLPEILQVWHV